MEDKKTGRRLVQIPHMANGGLFGGATYYADGGMQSGAVNGGMVQGQPSNTNLLPDKDSGGVVGVLNKDPYINMYTQGLNAVGNGVQDAAQGVGGFVKGLANSFTNQNQYQAQLAPQMQSDYGGVMGAGANNALAGYGNFGVNQAQQSQLNQALQGVANGTGPNPAQAMLNNQTGANVAHQAALMAGQRGAGANAGMIARQAAMAGSGIQQQAAGQGAALQAQQSLNALNSQGQILNNMGNQNISEQGVNAGLFTNAGNLQNAQNANMIQNYGMAQGLNQKTSQANTDASNKSLGGLMNMGMSALAMFAAKGGMVGNGEMISAPSHYQDHLKHMHSIYHADGGEIGNAMPLAENFKGVQGKIADWAFDGMSHNQIEAQRMAEDPRYGRPEMELPSDVKKPPDMAGRDFRTGGEVPGQALVAGDSFKNDIQPAMLSPKEIVLPRHITMAPDAPEKAKQFVAALLKKQGHGNSSHHKEFHKALKEAILSRKK